MTSLDLVRRGRWWLGDDPCPDYSIGDRLKAQMMGYRAVADTVRSTVTGAGGDAMVARLSHLREQIDQYAEACENAGSSTSPCSVSGSRCTTLRRPGLRGRRISVDVCAADSGHVRLEGEIKNVGSARNGAVRLGSEFAGPAESEPGECPPLDA